MQRMYEAKFAVARIFYCGRANQVHLNKTVELRMRRVTWNRFTILKKYLKQKKKTLKINTKKTLTYSLDVVIFGDFVSRDKVGDL